MKSDERSEMNARVRRVPLTPEQKAETQRQTDAFVADLRRAARDDSDPETRENARTLLDLREISY